MEFVTDGWGPICGTIWYHFSLSGISSPLPHPQTSQYSLDLFPLPSSPSHTLLVLFLIGGLPFGEAAGFPCVNYCCFEIGIRGRARLSGGKGVNQK